MPKKDKPELWPEIRLTNAMAGLIMLVLFKIVGAGASVAASTAHRRMINRRARRIVKK